MNRIPLTLVTGFLGSGKTTLIARLLSRPGFAATLVVVNEFGEVGIDHDLLEASSDDTILLANGCLCCTIRGNLVDTLLDVDAQVAGGRLRAFDRVVVETSGVADPAPLLAFLLGAAGVMARYRLEGVLATCDAVSGPATLARQPEAAGQARVADRLLVTKSDLVDPAALAAVTATLRRLNPVAEIVPVVRGEIDPALLFGPAPLGRAARAGGNDPGDVRHHHTDRFRTMVLRARRPLAGAEPEALVEAIREAAGPQLLRLKGILPLEGSERQVVLQAALSVVHPAEIRAGRAAVAGRLVVITEGEPEAGLLGALARFGLHPVEGGTV
jgi:G3E family GTPase